MPTEKTLARHLARVFSVMRQSNTSDKETQRNASAEVTHSGRDTGIADGEHSRYNNRERPATTSTSEDQALEYLAAVLVEAYIRQKTT